MYHQVRMSVTALTTEHQMLGGKSVEKEINLMQWSSNVTYYVRLLSVYFSLTLGRNGQLSSQRIVGTFNWAMHRILSNNHWCQSNSISSAHLYYFCWRKTVGPNNFTLPTVRTVGVGVTCSLLLWKFCWTYRFWLPYSKNYWPVTTVVETFDSFVVATLLSFVGPTDFICWETKSVGPTKEMKVVPTNDWNNINNIRENTDIGILWELNTLSQIYPHWNWHSKLKLQQIQMQNVASVQFSQNANIWYQWKYLQHSSEPNPVGTTKELQQTGHNYLQHQQFVERQKL